MLHQYDMIPYNGSKKQDTIMFCNWYRVKKRRIKTKKDDGNHNENKNKVVIKPVVIHRDTQRHVIIFQKDCFVCGKDLQNGIPY